MKGRNGAVAAIVRARKKSRITERMIISRKQTFAAHPTIEEREKVIDAGKKVRRKMWGVGNGGEGEEEEEEERLRARIRCPCCLG